MSVHGIPTPLYLDPETPLHTDNARVNASGVPLCAVHVGDATDPLQFSVDADGPTLRRLADEFAKAAARTVELGRSLTWNTEVEETMARLGGAQWD